MIVLDASVILKWIWKNEPRAHAARFYRDAHINGANRAAVPELLFYEIANALATKTQLSTEEAVEEFSVIVDAELDSYNLSQDAFSEAIRLSKQFKISLYDSSYIALASFLECDFVTADAQLAAKLKSLRFVKSL